MNSAKVGAETYPETLVLIQIHDSGYSGIGQN